LEYWQQTPHLNETDKVRICFVGSVTHLTDMKTIAVALKEVLKKYPDKAELITVGDLRFREVFKDTPNVECFLGVPFEAYADRLNGLGMDIGICPLRDTKFNRCKSHIKWMENTMAGGATVASPTVYDRVIRHGENGFLAKTKEDWVKYLSILIEDPTRRKIIRSTAFSEVISHHSLASHVRDWEKVYETILNK
jgi:glycosyltransferase involved in cell wall biosynthesis